MNNLNSILIAGEDQRNRSRITSALLEEGYQVTECSESVELLEQLIDYACPMKSFAFNLIISEVGLPSDTCIEFMEILGKHESFPPIILIMNQDDNDLRSVAQRVQSAAVFQQPFELEELLTTVDMVIREKSSKIH
jgi:DNA-binding response OmpR family regulator